ncbi:response regulator [Desulfovibrio mangrovi]|uniref:sensor histidine kinase n=1 Tax=Desulfovibrio mangrovi TaxID=2976983 RepID=UPI002248404F|nr:response regulator [Desulfovibrio mangrovi]UZP68337.1 response regulator [Desulfovibrio mangrovi]
MSTSLNNVHNGCESDVLPEVLLIDDEAGILKVLSALIADMGYCVLPAQSAEEALNLLSAQAIPVVITDIRMPGMDGVQLLRQIKKQWPDTEVIMSTGHADMGLAIESLRLGATDFLTKPINPDLLEFALRRSVERVVLRETVRRYTENLEKMVEQRTRELLQAERLAAMGETVAGMAHAIKNIAGGLEGALFVLEKGLELNKREYLEQGWGMVKRDVTRVRDLTMNMLQLSRPMEIRPEPIDPDQPVREVAELLASRIREAGGTLMHASAPQPEAMLDPEAIHACIMNLATNAVEAVEEAIQAGRIDHGDGRVILHTECNGGQVCYVVEDNGRGLSDEVFASIDDGMFTTKARGTGFGLMATRKAAREMGGELVLENGIQGGVRATLRLPLKPK